MSPTKKVRLDLLHNDKEPERQPAKTCALKAERNPPLLLVEYKKEEKKTQSGHDRRGQEGRKGEGVGATGLKRAFDVSHYRRASETDNHKHNTKAPRR